MITENVTELIDQIEELFDKYDNMDGRKKKEVQDWKIEINELIEQVNLLKGFKIYVKR